MSTYDIDHSGGSIAIKNENPSMRENLVMTSAFERPPVQSMRVGKGFEGILRHASCVCLGKN